MSDDGVRVWLDRELNEELKQAAAARGLSARTMMERMLAEGLKTEVGRQARVAGMKADSQLDRMDRIVGEMQHATGRVDHLLDQIGTMVPQQLKKEFDTLKTHVSNTGGTAHLRDLLKQLLGEYQRTITGKLEAVKDAADQTAEHARTRKAVAGLAAQQMRLRQAAVGGAAAVIVFLAAFAFLFANTSPTRWMATRLTGQSSSLGAAYALFGNENLPGPRMRQVRDLVLDTPAFSDSMKKCLTQAEKARENFPCTVTMGPVMATTPEP